MLNGKAKLMNKVNSNKLKRIAELSGKDTKMTFQCNN